MTTNSTIAPSLASVGELRENDASFLQRFAVREAQNRAARRKPTLSVAQHAAHRAQLSNVRFVKPKYSDQTEINVSGIFNRWKRYCTDMKVGDWEATIKDLRRETTQDFFLYVCEHSKITSWGSGEEYIRQFQQLYTTVNGQYMDRNDAKEVYKPVLSTHIDPSLRPPNIDGKPVLNVDNLRVILIFNIAYDTTIFPGERHRVQLAGCYQFLFYTGVRPAELVDAERRRPKDGSIEELFGRKVVQSSSSSSSSDDGEPEPLPLPQNLDEDSKLLDSLLL